MFFVYQSPRKTHTAVDSCCICEAVVQTKRCYRESHFEQYCCVEELVGSSEWPPAVVTSFVSHEQTISNSLACLLIIK